jgi:hypothetical protein
MSSWESSVLASNAGPKNASEVLASVRGAMKAILAVEQVFANQPTAFVMTTAVWDRSRAAVKDNTGVQHPESSGSAPLRVLGFNVETYATVRECLDRMFNQRPGERLRLVTEGPIPDDCADHPYMQMRRSLAESPMSEDTTPPNAEYLWGGA